MTMVCILEIVRPAPAGRLEGETKRGGLMNQRDKRQKKAAEPEKVDRVARQQAENAQAQPKRGCYQCVFYVSSALLWMRTLVSGFPIPGMCANHTNAPGQWRPAPGQPCRNFRAKPRRVEPPKPPNDQIRYIPLTRGLHAIIDADDYEWLSQYKWYAGKSTVNTYARRHSSKGVVVMHRQIMNPPKGMVVDHINGNGLDNRRCNLRICTPAENVRNRRKVACARSRFIGVFPRRNKWHAVVTHQRKTHFVGSFDDDVEAARARDRLALKLHGQFARLNFPPEGPPLH
jgi:hypothetical protein